LGGEDSNKSAASLTIWKQFVLFKNLNIKSFLFSKHIYLFRAFTSFQREGEPGI